MGDGDYEVDLIDQKGQIIGKKLRKDILKGVDAYHAVYCVVITPNDEIVLNLIADRHDMPNLHAGKYGCTAATIKRTGESGEQAAKRAVKNELKINEQPKLLHEELMEIDGTHRLIGWYVVKSEPPIEYNKEDIAELVTLSKADFHKMMTAYPEKITPPLKKFWALLEN